MAILYNKKWESFKSKFDTMSDDDASDDNYLDCMPRSYFYGNDYPDDGYNADGPGPEFFENEEETASSMEVEGVKPDAVSIDLSSSDSKLSHIELCDLMVQYHIFSVIDRTLYVWRGNHYQPLDSYDFSCLVRETLDGEYHNRIGTESSMKSAYYHMLTAPDVVNKFDKESFVKVRSCFSFINGVYDGKKKKIKKNAENLPLRFSIDASFIDKKWGDLHTPNLDNVILRATNGDRDCLTLFYEILGYLLSNDYGAKKFFVFGTAGDSGKSLLADFITELIGEEHVQNHPLHKLGDRFTLGKLDFASINFNMDLPKGALSAKAVSTLKQLTGDKRIATEEKGIQGKSTSVRCRFVFGTNFALELKEDDDAFWTRLVLLPFSVSVPEEERDPNLLSKLMKERDAIVTKAFWAYHDLVNRNYRFTQPKLAKEWIQSWRNNTTSHKLETLYRGFFDSCCVVTTEKSVFTSTHDLYDRFVEYCEAKGLSYPTHDIFIKTFKPILGVEKSRQSTGKRQYGFVGIDIKHD